MSPRERLLRNKSEVEIISGGAFLGPVFFVGALGCEWFVNKGLGVASNSTLLLKGGQMLVGPFDVDDRRH